MADMKRQGDILVAPKDVKLIDQSESVNHRLKEIGKNEKILAYGEKTGNSHTLSGDVTFYDNGNDMILCQVGREGSMLVHQEHDPINIDAGDYIVIRQREYDLLDGTRVVSD